MRAKRVVLMSNRSLLAAGVQKLLQGVDGLELAIVSAEDPEVANKLKKLAPTVIVLDSGDASIGEGAITQMLTDCPKAKVIAINLNRTAIDVYRVQRVLQTDLNGLLEAIQGKGTSRRETARKRDANRAISALDRLDGEVEQ